LHPDGIAEIDDYMPVGRVAGPDAQLVRRVCVVRGELPLEMECRPAFDYARARHATAVSEHSARFDGPGLSLGLAASVPLRADRDGAVAAFTLGESQSATFVLRMIGPNSNTDRCPGTDEGEEWFRETVDYWQRWVSRCTYRGRWREVILRSVLALKLLSYEPTGAIVAAPTTSLPEGVGGVRNWDYRYTWIRDAALTVYAFLRVGFTEEAARFRDWLSARSKDRDSHCDGPLQLMYAVDGRSDLTEEELTHFDGYAGSKPVRIGNAAHGQLQLDIYGELMDAVYLFNKYVAPVGYDGWRRLRDLVDWVAVNWTREDEGVWEVRGGRRHFVYSKFMCWVALDRGLRLADKRSLPADRAAWLRTRDESMRR
jgi:GH15 family glucan-1,4-alpha-glucosidase